MRDIELRHLRYFVAVAEEESIRRAAIRLHIAQPALSRQIRQLEESVGTALFERLPRGVAPTRAGESLLRDARHLLDDVDSAAHRARAASRGEVGRLRIGFIESAAWAGPFPRLLGALRTRFPEVMLEMKPMASITQREWIAAGKLDAGVGYVFGEPGPGVRGLLLRTDDIVLASPRLGRSRGNRPARPSDLADRAFVEFDRDSAPQYYDRIARACHDAGLDREIVQRGPDETSVLSLVSAGLGMAFVNSANMARRPQSVAMAPVAGISVPLSLHLMWSARASNPAVERLVEFAARLAR